MEDNFKLKQFINEDIDAPNNYRDIYSDVIKKTNNLNREAGILAYKDRKDIEVAKSILDGVYPKVKIRDIEKNEEDDHNYYLLYSYDMNESFDDELKFSPNLNPAGTPIGKWGGTVTSGMVESDGSNSMDSKEKGRLIGAIWDCLEDNSRDYPLDRVQGVVEYIGDFILDSEDDERSKYLPLETRGDHEYYTDIKDEDDLDVILEVLTIDELKEVLKSVKEDREEWERKDERYWEVEEDDPYEPWKDPDSDSYKWRHRNDTNESVEKHDTLNQKIFNGDELDPEVKDKLLEIVDRFKYNLEESDIKLDIKDVRIIGSNASYNYTDKSDIDLHIFADLSVYPDQEVLAQKVYDAYKALWNNKFDPIIRGHEVEIYVEPYTGD